MMLHAILVVLAAYASAAAPCATFMDRLSCHSNPNCTWVSDGSNQQLCKDFEKEPCAKHKDQPTCDVDTNCAWDTAKALCRKKNCNDLSRCDCVEDDNCFWLADKAAGAAPGAGSCRKSTFGKCPTMDVVVLVDGFHAMMEVIGDWLKNLPLSGEPAAVGAAAKADTQKVRVALIQFSGHKEFFNEDTNQFHGPVVNSLAVSPVGVGTEGGRLSGDLAELLADKDWHKQNYLEAGTYIEEGLAAAGRAFKEASVPVGDGRRRILLIFADGVLQDADKLDPARQVLDGLEVQTFGIVVRRFPVHTQMDVGAEATLKPITSGPHGAHFLNLMIDEVREKALDGICDPNGLSGHLIVDPVELAAKEEAGQVGVHKPCGDHEKEPCTEYTDRASCLSDPSCRWGSDAITNEPVCKAQQ